MKSLYLAIFVLFFSVQSFATVTNPPDWRGSPGSTYQIWDFSTSDTSPLADEYNNSYGTPEVDGTISGNWYDQRYGHQGVWYSESINLSVPADTTTLNNTKYQVQMIWNGLSSSPVELSLYLWDGLNSATTVKADIIEDNSILDPTGSAYWNYTTFELTTSPFDSTPLLYYEAEITSMSKVTSAYVDEIIVDAVIIPEPASLALLGLGGLLIRRKR